MKRSFTKALLIAALCSVSAASWANGPVTLKPMVEIDRAAIRLADVFDGLPEGLDRDIATAPVPGKSVTYDIRVLTQLAQQYRLEWTPQSPADKAILTRAATAITSTMIQQAVLEKLKENIADPKAEIEVLLDNRKLELFLPANKAPDFTLANFTYDRPSHRFRAELVAQTDSMPVNQSVTGRVLVKKSVPVLARKLDAGVTISESDLTWVTMNEDQIGADVVMQAEQLVGREMRRNHIENDFLRAHDVIEPRLVTRGALVTLKIQTPAMLITTQGKALQDGSKGDVVRVTNMQSNRVVEGTVEATGVVRVGPFSQMAAAR